jgi:tRNA U34 2-thiouridine synthase MnmA/TrmU
MCTSGNGCLASKTAAENLGVRLRVFEVTKEYLEIVKNPKYGYGSNMNPCLDCRIFMFKKAGEYMKAAGASFLVTGEVLGERPMSQRKDAMRIIERESLLNGLILRPLSAKLFEPTIPEKEGIIDRNRLLSIQGRCRRPQIQLAKEFNINDYPCPAGGCLLTYERFADKMRDLIKHKKDFNVNDVKLLKAGRHFRISPEAKLVVGRDKEDNQRLLNLGGDRDICFNPVEARGPVALGRGEFIDDTLSKALSIIARYCDRIGNERLKIEYKTIPDTKANIIEALPMPEEIVRAFLI